MKKVLITTLLAITASFAFAQGTVNFNNKVSASGVDGVITYAAGSGLGGTTGAKVDGLAHPGAQAALYGGADGTPEDQLVLIVPSVGFRSGAAAGYVNVGSAGSRAIPGVLPGQFAIVQIRAWDANGIAGVTDYDSAVSRGGYAGKSNLLRLATGGAGSPPGPAADLIGLQAFSINVVPEPGTIALGFLGLGALFALRRKK
jgi:hypothetical protein